MNHNKEQFLIAGLCQEVGIDVSEYNETDFVDTKVYTYINHTGKSNKKEKMYNKESDLYFNLLVQAQTGKGPKGGSAKKWELPFSKDEIINKSKDNKIPNPSEECFCKTQIDKNMLIVYKPKTDLEQLLFVGSICIKKFNKEMFKRRCVKCKKEHRCSSLRCNKCRIRCKVHDDYHDNNNTCIRCPRCWDSFQSEISIYCDKCRQYCFLHETYHDDNKNCFICIDCFMIHYNDIISRCDKCKKACRIHDTYHEDNTECKPLEHLNRLLSRTISYGQYKGLSYRELFKKNNAYINWLIRNTADSNIWWLKIIQYERKKKKHTKQHLY